jgi:AcrR family transcriptional regulator
MPRYKEEERDQVKGETRELLIEAAIEEFAREGFEKANINRISKNAGFAKGTIYNYFESKRMLMMALIDEIADTHIEYVRERVGEMNTPGERLESFFTAGFDWVTNNLAHGQTMINTLYGPDAEFKKYMFYAYEPMFALVGQGILALGLSQGKFRQIDPASTASLLMLMYLGIASQVNEEGKPWVSADEVTDFVFHALKR